MMNHYSERELVNFICFVTGVSVMGEEVSDYDILRVVESV